MKYARFEAPERKGGGMRQASHRWNQVFCKAKVGSVSVLRFPSPPVHDVDDIISVASSPEEKESFQPA